MTTFTVLQSIVHYFEGNVDSLAVPVFLTILLALIVHILNRPINRCRTLTDLGYVSPISAASVPNANGAGTERNRAFIRQLQKSRQLGKLPPVYPNGWFCVAESNELGCGDVRPVLFAGTQLVIFRGDKNDVFVTSALCPHLGVSLAHGGKVVNGDCIRCPFHGWTFSGQHGKCVQIPYSKGKIPEKAQIKTWPVVERNKHIYIWYHCDEVEPEWEIPVIDEIESGEWQNSGRVQHQVACHCEDIPENGADIAHLAQLHLHGITAGSDVAKVPLHHKGPFIQHLWEADWKATDDVQTPEESVIHLVHHLMLGNIKVPLATVQLSARQLGPGLVYMMFQSSMGRFSTLHHVTPEQPTLQCTRFVMFAPRHMPQALCNLFMWGESIQYERDIYMWNNKRYADQPLLVKEDSAILRHRRWYKQFYSDNSPRLLANGHVTNPPGRHNEDLLDW